MARLYEDDEDDEEEIESDEEIEKGEEQKSTSSDEKGEKKGDEFYLDIDFDSDDESYLPEGVKKADRKVWMKYYKQCYESEGYDIDDFPGVCCMTEIVPIDDIKKYPSECEELVKHIKSAIDNYNTLHDEAYEFKDLVKANTSVVAGLIYYVTFHVKNLRAGDDAPAEVFQAQVWLGIVESQVEEFRPKPKGK